MVRSVAPTTRRRMYCWRFVGGSKTEGRRSTRGPSSRPKLAGMEPWLSPLYDADGMRAVDRWAIEEMGVPSLELMEAAGRAVAVTVGELALDGPVRVVCGKGNNAGDGLVAARYLAEAGFEVEALLLW